jgi:hypothetical protein
MTAKQIVFCALITAVMFAVLAVYAMMYADKLALLYLFIALIGVVG